MPDLTMFVPITKIDAKLREVWGVMAEAAPDKSRERMLYDESKPYIKRWSDRIKEASGEKSLGNVRAMHGKVAAGKVISLEFDDDRRQVLIGTKIVDDNEWSKVDEGVYTGFSVGGRYARRDPADAEGNVPYVADPTEVSLVDNPCMYGATFQAVKADGATEMRKFVGSPEEPVQVWTCDDPAHEHVSKSEAVECRKGEFHGNQHARGSARVAHNASAKAFESEAAEDHTTAADAHHKAAEHHKAAGDDAKAEYHETIAAAHEKLARKVDAGDLDKVATREDVSSADKKRATAEYGDVTYADEKNKKYPIDTEEHIRAAWNYISKPKNAGKYDAADVKKIKAKIVSAWKKTIDKNGPPSAAGEKAMQIEELKKLAALGKPSGRDWMQWAADRMQRFTAKAGETFDAAAFAKVAGARFVELAKEHGVALEEPERFEKVAFDPDGWSFLGSLKTRQSLDALYVYALLESLLQSEMYEQVHDAEDDAQEEDLRTALEAIADFIASEIHEDEGDGGPLAMADDPADLAKRNAGPKDMINEKNAQEMHDHALSKGAKCKAAEKADEGEGLQKAAPESNTDELQKSLADVNERLAKFEAERETERKAGEERESGLRKQVDELRSQVDRFGKRIVEKEPARLAGKGGEPVAAPTAVAKSTSEMLTDIIDEVRKVAGQPAAESVAIRLGEKLLAKGKE